MGLTPTRRAWTVGWYRVTRDMGCTRRFALWIAWKAWRQGPEAIVLEPEPQRLIVEQHHIEEQRDHAWMQ